VSTRRLRRILRSILFDLILAWIRAAALMVIVLLVCGALGSLLGIGVIGGWLLLWAMFICALVIRREHALSKARESEADRRLGIADAPGDSGNPESSGVSEHQR
jgi:amino acid transporter